MTGPEPRIDGTARSALNRWLAAFAVAYGVFHHQGFLFAGLGNPGFVAGGGTRWADWLDLLTPVLVLGPAFGTLWTTARARPTAPWLTFAAGAVLYVEGHSIHLAANSIANEATAAGADPSPVTHLWDEPVSHHLWFGGVFLVVVALILGLRGWSDLAPGPLAWFLAAQFGFTYATNSLEGGTAVLGLVTSAGLVTWALAINRRTPEGSPTRPVPFLTLVTFVPTVVMLAGYGLLQRGFPQPSEIGWGVFG